MSVSLLWEKHCCPCFTMETLICFKQIKVRARKLRFLQEGAQASSVFWRKGSVRLVSINSTDTPLRWQRLVLILYRTFFISRNSDEGELLVSHAAVSEGLNSVCELKTMLNTLASGKSEQIAEKKVPKLELCA